MDLMRRGGYLEHIPAEQLFRSKTSAIESIVADLDHDICRSCEARIFRECQAFPRRAGAAAIDTAPQRGAT